MKPSATAIAVLLVFTCGCQGDSNPNVSRAHVGLKQLSEAAAIYRNNHKAWPDVLEDLTQPQPGGGEPLLDKRALKDPWGRPYQYDPTTTNPTTEQPLIWSDGPSPGEPGSKIANWVSKD
ncbi:MAG TPA: type II secretion system protein GspG [Gemmataceae bacterium]|nr:type II secretion system protein GspG [Gemmataceae bacterium]